MNNEPIVKEYSCEYQDQVVELILTIQQTEYNIPITKDDQPDLMAIEDFYQTGNGNFWVAVYNDKVIGTISLLDIGNHQVALRKMFVAKDYRGNAFNTARMLLNHALCWAKEKSVKEVYLGTTPQFLAAHRFYEKNGFESIDSDVLPENFPIMEVDKKFYRYTVN
ncbi:GNAT family N-acetyltransferase [Priestia koreensis]|uniref:GNAT family N-acetyltransferase n=1 Tax=Priestia koreensis TaxID=284581 RepID=UPI001F582DAE|nr:GNAT family N-acetyltransferase [Priestia koreensis]UNL86905.1 GNAT family N-acetyltransferase [Priestia koreensis]